LPALHHRLNAGIKWYRSLSGSRHFVKPGALGRPESDGRTELWHALLEASWDLRLMLNLVACNCQRLAREMLAARLPPKVAETVRAARWTTCPELLPFKER
jgi:hypothetical protein